MGKSSRNRAMPSTPRANDAQLEVDPDTVEPAQQTTTPAVTPPATPWRMPWSRTERADKPARPLLPPLDPDTEKFLVVGTECLAGHTRGSELDAGPLGRVPSKKTTWIGVSLVLWCGLGIATLFWRMQLPPTWVTLGVIVLLAWLAFSAVIQRRLGHRGRCWRVRTWRHAWGGLVPSRD